VIRSCAVVDRSQGLLLTQGPRRESKITNEETGKRVKIYRRTVWLDLEARRYLFQRTPLVRWAGETITGQIRQWQGQG